MQATEQYFPVHVVYVLVQLKLFANMFYILFHLQVKMVLKQKSQEPTNTMMMNLKKAQRKKKRKRARMK